MENKYCLIYNYAQHYRLGIFKLLNNNLKVDFYFGDKLGDIKKIDYSELSNFKGELKNIKVWNNFYWQKGALRLLLKKYDNFILLGEYHCLSTWLFLFVNKIVGKKVFLWSHAWYGKENEWEKLVKKLFFSLANGVFLYGNYAKNLMIREGFNGKKLHVIYNSLDYDKQLEYRIQIERNSLFKDYFNNDNPVLIFIGRLTKVKKLNYVFEAIKILKEQNINLNLVLIGDGEENANLKESSNSLGLNKNIWFVGALYDEKEIANYIFNADLCISPGNVGLTAMHSMMYGTPVITNSDFTNQMPEFEAIVPGETGDFFLPDNVVDLSEKIKFWINSNHKRDFIRQKCYNKIDSFYNPYYQFKIISDAIKTSN